MTNGEMQFRKVFLVPLSGVAAGQWRHELPALIRRSSFVTRFTFEWICC